MNPTGVADTSGVPCLRRELPCSSRWGAMIHVADLRTIANHPVERRPNPARRCTAAVIASPCPAAARSEPSAAERRIAHAVAIVLEMPGDTAQEIRVVIRLDDQVVPAERRSQRPA